MYSYFFSVPRIYISTFLHNIIFKYSITVHEKHKLCSIIHHNNAFSCVLCNEMFFAQTPVVFWIGFLLFSIIYYLCLSTFLISHIIYIFIFFFQFIYSTGPEYEGAFAFLLQLLSTEKDNMSVLRRAFLRQNLPNLVNFLATFFVFVIVIYLKVGQILHFMTRDLFSF